MAIVNLRHIEVFHAVTVAGSLTEAARLLHTSQPTVSRELTRFEEAIGLKLSERICGRLHPTVQGLRLFEEVQRSWYGLDRTVSAAESLRKSRQGELSIARLPVFSQSSLPQLLQSSLARYPDASLDIAPQESPLLEEWLSAQRHDLGLIETLHAPVGTERAKLLSLDEVCVLPPGHPLAVKKVLMPDGFHGESYISLSRIDSYCQLLDQLFTENQAKRRMTVETHSVASVCAMARAGVGVSVVNPLTALDYAASGLTVRRSDIAVLFIVSLTRPPYCLSPALAQVFSKHLQTGLSRLVIFLDATLSPATTTQKRQHPRHESPWYQTQAEHCALLVSVNQFLCSQKWRSVRPVLQGEQPLAHNERVTLQ